ncbi:MAG: zinc-finger domain-containing protein [Pseudomonadota bacterium]
MSTEKPLEEVTPSDLPLSCPRPNQALWNKHPRVFLTFDRAKEVACPYCGTRYHLVDAE